MNNDLISREALKKAINELFFVDEYTVEKVINNAPTVEPISVDEYRNKLIGLFHETGHDELITFICLPTETEYKILRDILLQYKFEPQRPHGEWIHDGINVEGMDLYHCSICNRTIVTWSSRLNEYPYCHCGAIMKGGAE